MKVGDRLLSVDGYEAQGTCPLPCAVAFIQKQRRYTLPPRGRARRRGLGFGMDHPCLDPRHAAILCVLVSSHARFMFDGRRQEYV
jgi:hypothetical protein